MAVESDRRVALNRDRVLRAAMILADEHGIEALSMRKLGQALGVEAMALYNHVANKDDLLDGLGDLVVSQFELPSPDEDWETAVWRLATSAHDALLQHPWACTLILSSSRARRARLHYMEALLRCLRQSGFSPEESYHAYHALDSHILGFTLWQLGHVRPAGARRATTREEFAVLMASVLPGFSLDEYPYLLEHGELHFSEGKHKEEGEFEFGLQLILDGLKRMRGTF